MIKYINVLFPLRFFADHVPRYVDILQFLRADKHW
jgi:hypothetical protein